MEIRFEHDNKEHVITDKDRYNENENNKITLERDAEYNESGRQTLDMDEEAFWKLVESAKVIK